MPRKRYIEPEEKQSPKKFEIKPDKTTKEGKCECCGVKGSLYRTFRSIGMWDEEIGKGLNTNPRNKESFECDDCKKLSDRQFIEKKYKGKKK